MRAKSRFNLLGGSPADPNPCPVCQEPVTRAEAKKHLADHFPGWSEEEPHNPSQRQQYETLKKLAKEKE